MGLRKIRERMAHDLALLESQAAPAAIGITDNAFCVGDQDQALRMAQDLAGKVALFLQLRLRLPQSGDIEHQTAVLHHAPAGIAHRITIHVHIDGGTILAAQHFFMVVHFAGLPKLFRQFLPPLRRKIKRGRDVQLKNFLAAVVAQNADQRIVDFDEPALAASKTYIPSWILSKSSR